MRSGKQVELNRYKSGFSYLEVLFWNKDKLIKFESERLRYSSSPDFT